MRKLFGILLASLSFNQMASAAESAKLVERFVQAFNQHNVDAMLELSTEDLHWMSVTGPKITIETSNQAELQESMVSYFESTPSVRSEVHSVTESGPFVFTVEEAFWLHNGIEKSQCSIAVYQFESAKIQSVWYFPEHSCE